MGKTLKIVICGATGVGKTAIVENVVYGDYANKVFYCLMFECIFVQSFYFIYSFKELNHTKEDVYLAQVETERGVKENVRIQDTCGSVRLNEQLLVPTVIKYIKVNFCQSWTPKRDKLTSRG